MQQQLQPLLFPAENPSNTDNSPPKEELKAKNDSPDYEAADVPDPPLMASKLTPPSNDSSSSQTTVVTIPQLPDPKSSLSARITASDTSQTPSTEKGFFIPMDPELIRHFEQVGTRYFKNGDYANAKKHLEESLKHSEMKYGKRFEGRQNMVKRLRASYWVLCDWNSLRRILTNTVNENSTDQEDMLQVLHDLSELHFVAPPVDLISAERVCRETIQKKIDFLKTREHGSVYESLDLLVRILDAKGEYLEAEGYRRLVPSAKLGIINSFSMADEASYQLETWCRMSNEFAAAQVDSRFFLNLILFDKPTGFLLGKCDSVRRNILKAGVLGSTGHEYTIGHALIEHGREEALQFLLKRGFNVETVDDNQNTLLALAVLVGRQTLVRLLLDYGADINAPGYWLEGWGDPAIRLTILRRPIGMTGHSEISLMLNQRMIQIKAEDVAKAAAISKAQAISANSK